MNDSRSLLLGWPALMTLDIASLYLAMDSAAFQELAESNRVFPVQASPADVRWRKSDIDKLIKKLSADPSYRLRPKVAVRTELNEVSIDKIAERVAEKLRDSSSVNAAKLVSINSAAKILGVGRSTIYRLLEKGELTKRNIGSRALILRADIDRLLDS